MTESSHLSSPAEPAVPGERADVDDEELLDDAFARLVDAQEDGVAVPSVDELVAGREHLRARVEELRHVARTVARSPVGDALPVVPGFTLLAELGRGGMGAVYLARQEKVGGRRVALKVLPATAHLSARARERFLTEARAIAELRHPHVVTLYDVVATDEICAYAMELVQGVSLAQLVDDLEARRRSDAGVQPTIAHVRACLGELERTVSETYPIFVCRVGIAVARALGELHRAGLVHRDVKPSNILLRRDGTALLSDFGLVHAVDESLTQGGFVGTVAYASPEQLACDPDGLDARSDVYSLGVTLYRALTLRLPFDARRARTSSAHTPAGMLRLIESRRSVPLRARDGGLPRDLETIVAKATDVDPARRYASADEIADDLERMLSLRPIRARPAGALTRAVKLLRRHRASALGVFAGSVVSLALALAAVVYVFLVPRWVEEHLREARLALLDPLQANLLFVNVYWGPGVNDGSAVIEHVQLQVAVDRYDAALRWAPSDAALRRERDVVRTVLDAPDAARALVETSEDLRSAGLAAYLLGDVDSALRSWERYGQGLDPGADIDPLVETGLGILYLVLGEPARAYPRLRDACQAFPRVGFLTSYLADAALRCGDHQIAERLLEAASGMPRQDPQLALIRIRADLLAAKGRDSEAEALYRRLAAGTPGNLHHARLLHANGRIDEAVDRYVVAVSAMRGPTVLAEYARVLEGWWGALGPEERLQRIQASVGSSPWDAGSLVARLRYYTAGAESEELRPDQRGPLKVLELADLARALDVQDVERWSQVQEYPPLLLAAERAMVGRSWRRTLAPVVRWLAIELARAPSPRERASPRPSVVVRSEAAWFRGLGDLPGGDFSSSACVVSSDGSTVGGGSASGLQGSDSEPFVWRADTGLVPLGTHGSGEVLGLSADGSVAVGCIRTPGDSAFRWTRRDGLVDLHAPDGVPTMASSVSEDGFLVAGQGDVEWRMAGMWSSDRGWVRLDAEVECQSHVTSLTRNGRWAAGYVRSLADAPRRAVRWATDGGERRVAARASAATGVADDGTVVGCFDYGDPNAEDHRREAMVWTCDAPPRALCDLPGGARASEARAISRDGTWIAGYAATAAKEEAVLWDAQRRLHRVAELLDASGVDVPSGWALESCSSIVQNGDLLTLCGAGTNPAGDREAWLARLRVARPDPPSEAPDAR